MNELITAFQKVNEIFEIELKNKFGSERHQIFTKNKQELIELDRQIQRLIQTLHFRKPETNILPL